MSTLKFGVDVKEFDDLFKNGNNDLQVIIDNALVPRYNSMLWRRYFTKSDMPTPVNEKGVALFEQISIVGKPDTLMLPRAAWTPPAEASMEGFNSYSGSLANYGFANTITGQERDYYAKMLQRVGGNETVLGTYMRSLDRLVKGGHATLTNLCFQLLSKGQYVTPNTTGFSANGKANIPAARFKTAGTYVWSNADADILGKMADEEKALRDATGYAGALSWKMDRTTFNNLMNNTAIKALMKAFVASNAGLLTTTDIPAIVGTLTTYNNWVSELMLPNISPIEIIEETQVLQENTYYKSNVSGWETGNAVLSPVGVQGEIKYADLDELKVLSSVPDRQMAYLEGGIFGIMNWIDMGRSPKWISEILGFFAPALSVFDVMTIVDTTTADPSGN